MESRRMIIVSIVIAAFVMTISMAASAFDEKSNNIEGAKLFKKYKCTVCHTVMASGIGKPKAADGKKEEEDNKGKTIKPPDLSNVGNTYDAEFLSNYLRKKANIDGRKHKLRFKGNKEQRAILVSWLESLKSQSGTAVDTTKIQKSAPKESN